MCLTMSAREPAPRERMGPLRVIHPCCFSSRCQAGGAEAFLGVNDGLKVN